MVPLLLFRIFNFFVLFRLETVKLEEEEGVEGEGDQMRGMLYTICSFILHQQRLRQQGAAVGQPSSPPAPSSPVEWDHRLQQKVGRTFQSINQLID